MNRVGILLIVMIVFSASFSARAQDESEIRVDSAIVRLNVGVVDNRGRPITSLGQHNFSLFEDGIKQEITRFETTLSPFSVVLLLDMSGSTQTFRQNIKLSAARFLDALGPEDRIAVVEFYSKIHLLNDFTTNRRTAANSIQLANGRGPTELYRALDFALEKLARENTRRKAIVVLTDGIDTKVQDEDRRLLTKLDDNDIEKAIKPENSATLNAILSKADAQGVTIYPLALPTGDPARLPDPTPRQIALFKAARERLGIIAVRTGGTLNKINRLEEMGRLYAEVAADLRTLYTIEYQPSNLIRDGRWRSIRIEVTNPNLIPRSKQGYFAK